MGSEYCNRQLVLINLHILYGIYSIFIRCIPCPEGECYHLMSLRALQKLIDNLRTLFTCCAID